MGDIADDEIQDGEDAWVAHCFDECGDDCEYCQQIVDLHDRQD